MLIAIDEKLLENITEALLVTQKLIAEAKERDTQLRQQIYTKMLVTELEA